VLFTIEIGNKAGISVEQPVYVIIDGRGKRGNGDVLAPKWLLLFLLDKGDSEN
jgi:hypothetical protein